MAAKNVVTDASSQAEEVLARLDRVIRRSNAFVLGFVQVNSPSQQENLRSTLIARMLDMSVLEIKVNESTISLLDAIEQHWNAAEPPAAVCVYGLALSLQSGGEASPVLGRLNNDRELIRKACPVPLLLWLPQFALDLLSRGAPDFWAWRSGVYAIPTDPTLWLFDGMTALSAAASSLHAVTAHEKLAELRRVRDLILAAQVLPKHETRVRDVLGALLYRAGALLESLGNFDEAEADLLQSLAIFLDIGNESYASLVMIHLGNIALVKAEYSKAEPLYRRALEIDQRLFGEEGGRVLPILNNLAVISDKRGDHAKAEMLYWTVVEASERTFGREHPYTAASLNNLAEFIREKGDLGSAETMYRRALDIQENSLGPDHPDTATTLSNLGKLYRERGDYAKAESYYKRALGIREQTLGHDHPRIAASLNNLGQIYRQQENFDEAERSYLRSLDMLERTFGPNHPDAATVSANLASIYYRQSDLVKAEAFYRRALRSMEKGPASGPLNLASMILTNLADIVRAQGRNVEADELLRALQEDSAPPVNRQT